MSDKEMAEKAFTGVQCPIDKSKAEGNIEGVALFFLETGKPTKCWPMVAAEFRLERSSRDG